MQQYQIIYIGELFEDCGSQIVCIKVKREMSQDRSLKKAFSQTSKLALLVASSKEKTWFWASSVILTIYLEEISAVYP